MTTRQDTGTGRNFLSAVSGGLFFYSVFIGQKLFAKGM
jgi:hypothetical protein